MIGHFVKPAVAVEAVQFTGDNIYVIFDWLHGLFHIQQGQDHDLRLVSELTEEGRVLETAPSFLVIRTRTGEDRVNIGDWIVKYDEDRISVYSEIDFSFNFEKSAGA